MNMVTGKFWAHGEGNRVGLRDEKKRETHSAIVRTALDMFRQQGFERTRVTDIVNRLRISEATFFNYFPTKDAVLEAAAEDLLARSMADLHHDVVEGGDTPVPERLRTNVLSFAESFAGDRQLARMVADHSRFFLAGKDRLDTALLLLTELMAEGQRRGELRPDADPRRLCELWMASVMAMVHGWAQSEADDSLMDRMQLAADVVLTGFRPADGPVTA